jgi:hypothetical protein
MPKSKTKHAKPKTSHQKPLAKTKVQPALSAGQRKLKQPVYKSFRMHKKIKSDLPIMAGAFRLFWRSLMVLKRHFRLFLSILLVYAVLNLLLVHGLANNGDLGNLKTSLNGVFKGSSGKLGNGLALFAYLLGGSSASDSANANAGVYQTLLIIIVSLALIWSLRQVYAKQKIRARDGFYRGVYPLVPFLLVLLVIGLQLLPLAIGGFLYGTVINNGIAVYAIEKILWALLFLSLALLSLYMLSSSVFALYVVTLPDMTPMKALKSARELVRNRRWTVLRKLIFLPVILVVLAAVIMVPAIIFLTPVAEWLYFVLTIIGLAVVQSYMYALYRELLP